MGRCDGMTLESPARLRHTRHIRKALDYPARAVGNLSAFRGWESVRSGRCGPAFGGGPLREFTPPKPSGPINRDFAGQARWRLSVSTLRPLPPGTQGRFASRFTPSTSTADSPHPTVWTDPALRHGFAFVTYRHSCQGRIVPPRTPGGGRPPNR
jgi:hypothetical protein